MSEKKENIANEIENMKAKFHFDFV